MTEEQKDIFENIMKILEKEFANDVEIMTYKDALRAKLFSLFEKYSAMSTESAVLNMFGDFLDDLPNNSPEYKKFDAVFVTVEHELNSAQIEQDFADWFESAFGKLRPDQLTDFTKEELENECRTCFARNKRKGKFSTVVDDLEQEVRSFIADRVQDQGDYRRIVDLIDFNMERARENYFFELQVSENGLPPDMTVLGRDVQDAKENLGSNFNEMVSNLDLDTSRGLSKK